MCAKVKDLAGVDALFITSMARPGRHSFQQTLDLCMLPLAAGQGFHSRQVVQLRNPLTAAKTPGPKACHYSLSGDPQMNQRHLDAL